MMKRARGMIHYRRMVKRYPKSRRLVLSWCMLAAVSVGLLLPGMAGSAAGGRNAETILIGIAAAKQGIMAPYDLDAARLFQMRIDKINKAGGVLGKRIRVEWIDTKSDLPAAATAAEELIGKGAVAIIASCDFDHAFPAINAARARKVLALALCASSPKVATPAVVGPYGGSMGLGSDTEGAGMAEWLRKNRPALKRAYIFKDTSLEYTKATADYFKARWTQLGGNVCGEDTFVGGPNLDLSSQITRFRAAAPKCDVVFSGSWQPFAGQLVRAIRTAGITLPIAGNAATNGVLLRKVAGNVSNVYVEGYVCLPLYCSGERNPRVRQVNAAFKKRFGYDIPDAYNTRGYDLAGAVVEAIRRARSTKSKKIANALFNSTLVLETLNGKQRFTSKCHRPQPASYSIELFTKGKGRQIDVYSVQFVPNIGDGSACWGKPPAVK